MTTTAALDDIRWLIGDQGRSWLDRLDPAAEVSPALVTSLRRELSAERSRLLIDQLGLRRRAAEKFSQPGAMFFTQRALEQATDEWIAAYKATRFGLGPAFDLCCGIGGDLRALAATRDATGVDRDPVLALLAAANAPTAHLVSDDVNYLLDQPKAISNGASWHIDPDRRAHGRRVTSAAHYEPPPEFIDQLLSRAPQGAIKLAPAAHWPEAWNAQAEFEWISRCGECRQLVAWFNGLTTSPGTRRATMVHRQHGVTRTLVGKSSLPPLADSIGQFIFEPDAAVLAAGLTNVLSDEHELTAITPGGGYLTGEESAADAALAVFEVVEQLPFDAKRLKQSLRVRNADAREIKKRDVEIEPEKLRQQLRGTGEEPVTLILTTWERQTWALICRRVAPM